MVEGQPQIRWIGLQGHGKEFGLHAVGDGELWEGFRQESDRVLDKRVQCRQISLLQGGGWTGGSWPGGRQSWGGAIVVCQAPDTGFGLQAPDDRVSGCRRVCDSDRTEMATSSGCPHPQLL